MKNVKHTPGPWVAVQTNLVTTKAAWESQDLGTLKFAFQATVSLKEGEAQAEANARLIAAAPEMFDTLTLCLEFIDSGGLGQGVNAHAKAIIEQYISKALAKARGE